jgi:hypothetical protein
LSYIKSGGLPQTDSFENIVSRNSLYKRINSPPPIYIPNSLETIKTYVAPVPPAFPGDFCLCIISMRYFYLGLYTVAYAMVMLLYRSFL